MAKTVREPEKGTFTPVEVSRNHKLSWQQKIFMGDILYYHNKGTHGGCHCSDGYFARKHEINRANVNRAIKEMVKKKVIKIRMETLPNKTQKRWLIPLEGAIKSTARGRYQNDSGGCYQYDDEDAIKMTAHKEYRKNTSKNNANACGDSNKLFSASFSGFWERYPKKVGRKETLAAWQKLKPADALVARIMAALETQIKWREQKKAAGEFAPAWKDPVRWLKKEAWADELDPVEADNTIDHWQPPSLEQVEQIKKQCDQQYAGESHGH